MVAIASTGSIILRTPFPDNETVRLKALSDYEALDAPPELNFDVLTLLASLIRHTPLAPLSLLDANRQWFQSRVGIDAVESSRDVAFCAHAILQDDILIVPGASADERFADNPLVTGAPHIRFYAGAQLKSATGLNLGTVSVIDRHTRKLSANQQSALRAVSRQVVAQLEFRRIPVSGTASSRRRGN